MMNTMHGILTLILLLVFVAYCTWVFWPSRKKIYDEDAKLPFADEPQHSSSTEQKGDQS